MTDRLLEILRSRANHRGLAFAEQDQLLDELRCEPADLSVALEGLVGRRAIEVLSPLPYLVTRIRSWSGETGHSAETRVVPYSFSRSHSMNNSKDSYRDAPRGSEALLQEVLDALGETDPEPFRKAIEYYAPHVIRTALERVRKAQSIQKTRTALFRYLLPRIAKEQITKR